MSDKICIHIDVVSNAVLSRGLQIADFTLELVHQPKNLLLLDANSNQGELDIHTGLKVIRGNEAVLNYFRLLQKRNSLREIKWIDFSDSLMLKELSPIEISELLYLGHTKTHLRSPFFYKLQNNFVYFEFGNDSARVYYRYLDEFYQVLARKLTHILELKLNEKRSFFKKGMSVDPIETSVLKKLKNIFQEGVCFNFEKAKWSNNEYQIPVYVVEDRFWKELPGNRENDPAVATVVYNLKTKKWTIQVDEEDIAFLPTKNTI